MTQNAPILANLVKSMKRRGQDPLRPLLDAYMLERGRQQIHDVPLYSMATPIRPGGRFSPSDLCGCERAAAFKFLGVKARKQIDPDQELVFDDGNWRHLKWESIFHDMERVLGSDRCKVLAVEQYVAYEDLYIAGSLDAILALRPHPRAPRRKWVVDIKGINDRGFNWIVQNQAPIPKHVKQLVAYERSVQVPRGLLWYENKNNQHTKAFVVRYDDHAWHEVEAWCRSVLSFLERRRVPPKHPDCDRGTFGFARCPYAAWCFGSRSPETVKASAYHDFEGVEAAWIAGHREADE